MARRPVGPDRLALPLFQPQRRDDRRPEQKDEDDRRHRRAGGPESNVAKDIQNRELVSELTEEIEHQANSCPCRSSASAWGSAKRRLRDSTSTPIRLAFEP